MESVATTRTMRAAIVHRDEVPAMSEITLESTMPHESPERSFRAHPVLSAFLPTNGRISLSWIHLHANEALALQCDPARALLVVMEGSGEVDGDLRGPIDEGDMLVFRERGRFGLRAGANGMWALRARFDGGSMPCEPLIDATLDDMVGDEVA